ncbi:MAG: cyanoexosortase A system-associated protein [Calothrix sp. MO_167.B12]|nr:cyanoexosortase A system-associated protein [Calothrix sp. MO_167.B12]
MKIISTKIRISLLALTFFSVFISFCKLKTDANAANRQVTQFIFPSQLQLMEGQIIESKLLKENAIQQRKQYDSVITGNYYRYYYKGLYYDVEMRYVVGTLGNVEGLISNLTKINLPAGKIFKNIKNHDQAGFYSLFTYENKAYLSSCINPRGASTVSPEQFLRNRRKYDLRTNRFLPWFSGRESLIDRRCLWAHLSTPLKHDNSQFTYQLLEKVWLNWYQLWSNKFPQH